MRILEYIGLDISKVKASYRKVADAIARGDFRAAQVKKLANMSHGKYYRAKLDDADRLLFTLVRHGEDVCVLLLEVIANHNSDKSRFLRGAAIDETKISDIEMADAIRSSILKQSVPPWPVYDKPWLKQTLIKVFREQAHGSKPRQQLLDYAAYHDEPIGCSQKKNSRRHNCLPGSGKIWHERVTCPISRIISKRYCDNAINTALNIACR